MSDKEFCQECGNTRTCQHCRGSGEDPDPAPRTAGRCGPPGAGCPVCGGSGNCPYCQQSEPAYPPRHRPAGSELYQYPRYGYDGDQKWPGFEDLDVDLCPRCRGVDIFPGQRVCTLCQAEIDADDFS